MSQWTHVNGNIRFDALRELLPNQNVVDVENLLGKTFRYEDFKSTWNACTVPCGSEGSLQYNIVENPRKSSLAAYSVSIYGDLRDYDNVAEILKWFKNVIMKWKTARQAVIEIDVEYGKCIVCCLEKTDSGGNKFIEFELHKGEK